ncbi:tetratricopeptide repeat protein [Streptomyces swartbergensis]|uniref:tetratricopeptide repeat protein n=1 Tax=Streptomyces swartbergensis TaxID=487165 RepID=UPI0038131599
MHESAGTAATAREKGAWADQLWRAGRVEVAEAVLEDALQMCGEEGDRRTETDLLNLYAQVLIEQARHEEAVTALERAVGVVAGFAGGSRLADAWEQLADTLVLAGRCEAAVVRYESALELFRDDGPVRRVAGALSACF